MIGLARVVLDDDRIRTAVELDMLERLLAA